MQNKIEIDLKDEDLLVEWNWMLKEYLQDIRKMYGIKNASNLSKEKLAKQY